MELRYWSEYSYYKQHINIYIYMTPKENEMKKISPTILNFQLFWCGFGTISSSGNKYDNANSSPSMLKPQTLESFPRLLVSLRNQEPIGVVRIVQYVLSVKPWQYIPHTLFIHHMWLSRMLLPFAHSSLPQTNSTHDCVITVLFAPHTQ